MRGLLIFVCVVAGLAALGGAGFLLYKVAAGPRMYHQENIHSFEALMPRPPDGAVPLEEIGEGSGKPGSAGVMMEEMERRMTEAQSGEMAESPSGDNSGDQSGEQSENLPGKTLEQSSELLPELAGLPSTTMANPLDSTPENIKKGETFYGYYCRFCHGENGKSQEDVAYGYKPRPTELVSEKVRRMSDGELVRAMLLGTGHEPVVKRIVPPEAYWYIPLFVRSLAEEDEVALGPKPILPMNYRFSQEVSSQ